VKYHFLRYKWKEKMNTKKMHWISRSLERNGDAPAIIRGDHITNYKALLEQSIVVDAKLDHAGVVPGDRVVLIGDFGTVSTALLLGLIERCVIIIPMTTTTAKQRDVLFRICAAQWCIESNEEGGVECAVITRLNTSNAPNATNVLYAEIVTRGVPGLVLFTSGSTGEPKAVVHDFSGLLQKFEVKGRSLRTLNFLLFDHWGGLNTLLHTLTSGGVVACPMSRNPEHICALIERYRLELLPASPSFLNMMLVAGAHKRHDLSSLLLITYGAEPMPASTLDRLNRELPNVEFRQTYGLIELGVLRAKSAGKNSLLVKLGGNGYDLRVVDGKLEIKARASMLGYLNAPSPFTDDGYFRTGDRVEEHGEYLKIIGRESEQINVGGEKVFPIEVETVLLECPLVADSVVYGISHPLSGKIVCADIVIKDTNIEESVMRTSIRKFCNERLESYKVPVKIKFVEGPLTGERQKRVRVGRS
jgi:long-chain acyl-CoA synthetase